MGAEATDSAYSRDLLRRCGGPAGSGGEGSGELDLGLSLGGCFSVNPREKRLPRSASDAADQDLVSASARGPARTWSLPVVAGERWKRKEVEGVEGTEAKRRRSEEKESCLRALSQCSVGAQGSGSSGLSDLESRSVQGFDFSGLGSCTEVGSPLTVIPSSDYTIQESKTVPKPMVGNMIKASKEENSLPKKMVVRSNGTPAAERNMLEEMPQVHTCGDGPNGKRIEGFLYNYRKGEVRIVCVCHGSFLTPAEFVKHAGGTDVTNPLRHIVVTTSPPAL